jgi:hypothetical protein
MSSYKLGKAKVKTEIVGFDVSQLDVAQIVYAKPTIFFEMPGQVFDEATGAIHNVAVEFAFKVDPQKLTHEQSSRIQACMDRINAAQRTTERFSRGQSDIKVELTADDLPNTSMMIGLYDDNDRANDQRLFDVVVREDGRTAWNYVDENGREINLTLELLHSNVLLGERMHAAFKDWYFSTKVGSHVDTKTKPAGGTGDSMKQTPNQSSGGSPTQSGAVTNPTSDPTLTSADISHSSTSQ